MNYSSWIMKVKKKLSFTPNSIILMYHRVVEPDIDPWQLRVSPFNFEKHLQVLKETGLVVAMPNFIEQIRTEKKKFPSIVITFDDGYADNFLYAKPLLEKYNLPATFFISTKNIGKQKAFWWDELADLILKNQNLPENISLTINREKFTFNLKGENILTENTIERHIAWTAYQDSNTYGSNLYMQLWRRLSLLNYKKQQLILKDIRNWANVSNLNLKENCCMSHNQLYSLASSHLFTIGAHTVSHPMLSQFSKKKQNREILKSKRFLEDITKNGIDIFAYPSGNYNNLTIQLLKNQSFKAAFTSEDKKTEFNEDPFQIGRFQVNNWTKSEFNEKLLHWLY